MSARCAMCKKAIVSKKGQLCIACQMGQGTTIQNPNNEKQSHLPAQEYSEVNYNHVIQTDGQDMSRSKKEIVGYYKGIVHNFHQTENQRSIVWKIWNSFVRGVPLSLSNVQYEFTLYEGSGTGDVRGHKVVVYGDAGYSLLSDGSTVSVSGKSDRNGVVVASEVKEINTGFRLRPKNAILALIIQVGIFVLLLLLVLGGLMILGNSRQMTETAGVAGDAVQESAGTYGFSLMNVLLAIIGGMGAVLLLKSNLRKKALYALLCILFALGMFSQGFLPLFVILILCMFFIR